MMVFTGFQQPQRPDPEETLAELFEQRREEDARFLLWQMREPLSWAEVSRCLPLTLGWSVGMLAAVLARSSHRTLEEIISRTSFRRADGRTVLACANPLCLAAAQNDLEAVKLLRCLHDAQPPLSREELLAGELAAWYRLAQMGQGFETLNWLLVLPEGTEKPEGEISFYRRALPGRDPLAAAVYCGAMDTALFLLPDDPGQLSDEARLALARDYADDPLAQRVREAVCARYGKSPVELAAQGGAGKMTIDTDPRLRRPAAVSSSADQSGQEHARFLQEMCGRYGLGPGEDWRRIEPLAMLDALSGPGGKPPLQALREDIDPLVRRICELDDDVMLSVLYPAAPELFLTPIEIPAEGEGEGGEMRLDAVCYCALLGSVRCLTRLLRLGADVDGLNCAERYNMADLVGESDSCPVPVTPAECALWAKSDAALRILWLWNGRTMAEVCGIPRQEMPSFLPGCELEPDAGEPQKPKFTFYDKLLLGIRAGCEPYVNAALDTVARSLWWPDEANGDIEFILQEALRAGLSSAIYSRMLEQGGLYARFFPSAEGEGLLWLAARYDRPEQLRVLMWHTEWSKNLRFPARMLEELMRLGRTECLSLLLREMEGGVSLRFWLNAETDPPLRAAQRWLGPYEPGTEMPAEGPVPFPPGMSPEQAARYASPAQLRRFVQERGPLPLKAGRVGRMRVWQGCRRLVNVFPPVPSKAARAARMARLMDAVLDACPPLLEECMTQKWIVLLCLAADEPPAALLRRLEGRPHTELLLTGDLRLDALLVPDGLLDRWQQRLSRWFTPVLDRNDMPGVNPPWKPSPGTVDRVLALLERCRLGGCLPQKEPSQLGVWLLCHAAPEALRRQLEPGGAFAGEDPRALMRYCTKSPEKIPAQNRAVLAAYLRRAKETYPL